MGKQVATLGARVLRGLSLKQSPTGDFTVDSQTRNAVGYGLHTAFRLRTPYAHRVVADHADTIKRRCAEVGIGVRVSFDDTGAAPVARVDTDPFHRETRLPAPVQRERARVPFTADHVHFVRRTGTMLAVYVADPGRYDDPAGVAGDVGAVPGSAVLGLASRVYRTVDGPEPGWYLTVPGREESGPYPGGRAAEKALRAAVGERIVELAARGFPAPPQHASVVPL